jgi:hypothetical protein
VDSQIHGYHNVHIYIAYPFRVSVPRVCGGLHFLQSVSLLWRKCRYCLIAPFYKRRSFGSSGANKYKHTSGNPAETNSNTTNSFRNSGRTGFWPRQGRANENYRFLYYVGKNEVRTTNRKLVFFFFFFFYSCCSHFEYRAYVKRFVSLQFLNLKQSVGLLGRGISPSQGRYLHTNTQTDIHASCGIRTHDSSVWAGEEISFRRRRGHCDRQTSV